MRCKDCKWYDSGYCTAVDDRPKVDTNDLCAFDMGEPVEDVVTADPDRLDRMADHAIALLNTLKTLSHMKRDGMDTDRAYIDITHQLLDVMEEVIPNDIQAVPKVRQADTGGNEVQLH